MHRFVFIWALCAAALGVAIIVLTYIEAAIQGVWFDNHGLADSLSAAPEIALGVIGAVLIIGSGIAAGLARTPLPDGDDLNS